MKGSRTVSPPRRPLPGRPLLLVALVLLAGWLGGAARLAAAEDDNYFKNVEGETYHREGCRFIEPGRPALELAEAAAGKRPCRTCAPPLPPLPPDDGSAKDYRRNAEGEAYHREDCRFVDEGAAAVTLAQAASGRRPCRVCQPPLPEGRPSAAAPTVAAAATPVPAKAMAAATPAPAAATPMAKPQPAPAASADNPIVYVTATGEAYHKTGCAELGPNPIAIDLQTARLSYAPCPVCGAPVVAPR